MIDITSIVIPLIVAAVTIPITAWLSIKTKYASTEEEAIDKLKKALKQIAKYVWIAALICDLVWNVRPSRAMTGMNVLVIVVLTLNLYNFVISSIVNRQLEMAGNTIKILERMTDTIKGVNNTIRVHAKEGHKSQGKSND